MKQTPFQKLLQKSREQTEATQPTKSLIATQIPHVDKEQPSEQEELLWSEAYEIIIGHNNDEDGLRKAFKCIESEFVIYRRGSEPGNIKD